MQKVNAERWERGPDIVVRVIDIGDIKAAQQFLLRNLKDLYGIEADYVNNADIWGMEEVYLKVSKQTMLGAFDLSGRLVGTIAVRSYDDRFQAVAGRYTLKNTAELGRCYIDQSLRRKGIGSQLVKAIFAFCAAVNYEFIYLHTHKFLPGGFQFWQKQAFKITVDTGDADETVHMEKVLK